MRYEKRLGVVLGIFILSMLMTVPVFAFDIRTTYVDGEAKYYMIDDEGNKITGEAGSWYVNPNNGCRYYFIEDNYIFWQGALTIDGNDYYFYRGRVETGVFCAYTDENGKDIYMMADENGVLYNQGWHSIEEYGETTWYYVKENKQMAVNEVVEINGTGYYFNDKCAMITGFTMIWDDVQEEWIYYYAKESGELYKKGWSQIVNDLGNLIWIYVKEDYTVAVEEFCTVNGLTYYFDADAAMVVGEFHYYDEETGSLKTGYADESGVITERKNTWYESVDKDGFSTWYYYDANGQLLTNGAYTISGKVYYFDTEGRMARGLTLVNSEGGTSVYVYAQDNGVLYKPGWYETENGWIYVQQDYTLAYNGIYTISGKKYHFDYNCIMSVGLISTWNSNKQKYDYMLAKANGVLADTAGWHSIVPNEGYTNWYYVKQDGTIAINEIMSIGGKDYYFNNAAVMERGQFTIYDEKNSTSKTYWAGEEGYIIYPGSWYKHGEYWYYLKEDGNWANQLEPLYINGKKYFFQKNSEAPANYLQIGKVLGYEESENHYYLTDEDGAVILGQGWKYYNGEWYYIYENGQLLGGAHASTTLAFTYIINGACYAFSALDSSLICNDLIDYSADFYGNIELQYVTNADGVVLKDVVGWHKAGDDWYYFKSKGKPATLEKLTINGVSYFFDANGHMTTNAFNDNYYTNASGAVVKNQWIQNGIDWSYAGADGSLMCDEWLRLNGKWYYFDGIQMVTGYHTIKGITYEFNQDGVYIKELGRITGWKQLDGVWHYFDQKGNPYTGWVDNMYYIIDGVMQYETMVEDYSGNNGYRLYFFDKNGKRVTGWYRMYEVVSGEYTWFYAPKNGEIFYFQDGKGWKEIDGVTYYFGLGNNMYEGLHVIDGKLHRFSSNGAWLGTVTGSSKWIEDEGEWYYLDQSGFPVAGEKGLDNQQYKEYIINGKTYVFYADGKMQSDKVMWSAVQDKYIYINPNGVVTSPSVGWHKADGKWFYCDTNEHIATGLLSINGKSYYFTPYMSTGYTEISNGDKLFFSENGVLQTPKNGWVYDGEAWYYFKNDEAVNGIQPINGKTYYFSQYKMQTGVYYDYNAESYIFNSNGELAKNQWIKVDGIWYYTDSRGKSLIGTHVINGVTYIFDKFGRMIE